jgi:hypothetical protein
MLSSLLHAERTSRGRDTAWVQWADIQGEEWAKDLEKQDALDLVETILTSSTGRWGIVNEPVLTEDGFQGAQFTDAEGMQNLYGGLS